MLVCGGLSTGYYRQLLCELFGTAEFDPEVEAKRLRKAMRGWGECMCLFVLRELAGARIHTTSPITTTPHHVRARVCVCVLFQCVVTDCCLAQTAVHGRHERGDAEQGAGVAHKRAAAVHCAGVQRHVQQRARQGL